MTDHVRRLYAVAGALLALALVWAVIAAHPWASHATGAVDRRLLALRAREVHLRHEAAWVRRTVERRWARYRVRLARRRREIAAAGRRHDQALAAARRAASAAAVPVSASAPAVSVVTLPPLTITRTS
jgi:hypothetical protein